MAASSTTEMQWVNALSTRPSLEAAVDEVVTQVHQKLQGTPDLAILFISATFSSDFPRLMPLLREKLDVPHLIGCSGGGIVGCNAAGQTQEIEETPALALTVAKLPGVSIRAFHLSADEIPDLDSPPSAWIDLIGVPPEAQPKFVLLADPFSAKINDLLQGLDFAYAGSPTVGGLAGGGSGTNNGLFCNYQLHREGSVGLALSGNIVLETIVAQGCRPIGKPYRVAEVERHIMLKLSEQDDADLLSSPKERTPLEVLQEIIQDLSDEDRALAQHSLFVGLARNEFKRNLEQGDFLIRNLLGVDPRVGAIAIGDRVRPGQRIQFHLRDANTSAEDLEILLQRYQSTLDDQATQPVGALMFSCMGRGEGLYEQPNFDSQLVHRYLGPLALSGFFCNGEIGPVGGGTFLHGYTSVLGICRQPSP